MLCSSDRFYSVSFSHHPRPVIPNFYLLIHILGRLAPLTTNQSPIPVFILNISRFCPLLSISVVTAFLQTSSNSPAFCRSPCLHSRSSPIYVPTQREHIHPSFAFFVLLGSSTDGGCPPTIVKMIFHSVHKFQIPTQMHPQIVFY